MQVVDFITIIFYMIDFGGARKMRIWCGILKIIRCSHKCFFIDIMLFMKNSKALFVMAVLAAVSPIFAGTIEIVAPKEGESVATLTEAQKSFIAMDPVERKEKFRDKETRGSVIGKINKNPQEGRLSSWPAEIKLAWKGNAETEYTVVVVRKKDGAVHFDQNVKGTEVGVDNLEVGTEYEWTVTAGEDAGKGTFRTEDAEFRIVRFPGIFNVRDIGGAKGLGGKRIRQGMIYRSGMLNNSGKAFFYTDKEIAELKIEQPVDKNGKKHRVLKSREPAKPRLNGKQLAYITERFAIKTDIDIRNDGECYGMTNSPLGAACNWAHIPFGAYGVPQSCAKSFKEIFRLLLDEKNYPVDFHCGAGQDRTGMLAFILEGLLGASEDHLLLDWQMTGFWNPGIGGSTGAYDKMLNDYAKRYPGTPLLQAIEKAVHDIGIKDEEIAKFREIMLE